jgi:hypothetical protein
VALGFSDSRRRLVVGFVSAVLLVGLLAGSSVEAGVASGSALSRSGVAAAPVRFGGTWALDDTCTNPCAGEVFTQTIVIDQKPGASSFTGVNNIGEKIEGTQSGLSVHCTETLNGYPDELATITITLAKDGRTFTGSYVYKNGTGGTIKATRVGVQPTTQPALSVSLTVTKPKLGLGATEQVMGTTTAVGSAFSDVSVGLVPALGGLKVTMNPPGVSNFSLAEDASRSFEFTVKGTTVGNAALKLEAGGDSDNNRRIYGASRPVPITVVEGALSVTDVARGTGALSEDVRVKLDDSSTDASGCDPDASYDFSDTALSTVKKLGPCKFELTFAAPGTGIYHVGLRATETSGTVIPLSVDQYGQSVDGRFTLIIDSCSQPDDIVADVDALQDDEDSICAVDVGNWDGDSADVATKVIAAAESAPTLELDPIPVDSIDPSDWSGRGLVIGKSQGYGGLVTTKKGTGWIPTGTNLPATYKHNGQLPPLEAGEVVGLVSRVNFPSLPDAWGGFVGKKPTDEVPPYVVISSHGLWYTPNGLIRVPAGDQISTYVPIGTVMLSDWLGNDIDTGHIRGDDTKYLHVYTAGQLMPNFTFVHYDGPHQGTHVVNPEQPITLNNLIRPGEGRIAIAACASLYIPEGLTLTQALAQLPIHRPGVSQAFGFVRGSITANGELQTS